MDLRSSGRHKKAIIYALHKLKYVVVESCLHVIGLNLFYKCHLHYFFCHAINNCNSNSNYKSFCNKTLQNN